MVGRMCSFFTPVARSPTDATGIVIDYQVDLDYTRYCTNFSLYVNISNNRLEAES